MTATKESVRDTLTVFLAQLIAEGATCAAEVDTEDLAYAAEVIGCTYTEEVGKKLLSLIDEYLFAEEALSAFENDARYAYLTYVDDAAIIFEGIDAAVSEYWQEYYSAICAARLTDMLSMMPL